MAKDEKGHGSEKQGGGDQHQNVKDARLVSAFSKVGEAVDRAHAEHDQHGPNHGEPQQHPQASANAIDVHAEVNKIFGPGGRYDNTAERNQKGGIGQAHYAFHERGK